MAILRFLINFSVIGACILLLSSCSPWDKNTIQPNPNLTIAQTQLSFVYGETELTKVFTQSLALTNDGTTILIIDSVTSSHPLNFGAKELYGQIVIKPNETKNLPIQFMAKQYGSYSGKLTIHNDASGQQEIPVTVTLDCAVDNAALPFFENEIDTCYGESIPTGSMFFTKTNFYSDYCASAGTFAEIISLDKNAGTINIQWRETGWSYLPYDNATIKVILKDETFGIQESNSVYISPTDTTATFYLNFTPNTISKTKIMLLFDATYQGVSHRFFSGTIPLCI